MGNLTWLTPQSNHVASFMRIIPEQKLYGLFNFSKERVFISWYIFKEHGATPEQLFDHWNQFGMKSGADQEYLILEPYSFCLMEAE